MPHTRLHRGHGDWLRPAGVIVLGMTSLFLAVGHAAAQDTRAEVISQEQAARQRELRPPQANGVERLIDRLEDWGLIAGAPDGVYPWFGSVYPGGGFAAGAGVVGLAVIVFIVGMPRYRLTTVQGGFEGGGIGRLGHRVLQDAQLGLIHVQKGGRHLPGNIRNAGQHAAARVFDVSDAY